jgi:hypothetical protein
MKKRLNNIKENIILIFLLFILGIAIFSMKIYLALNGASVSNDKEDDDAS